MVRACRDGASRRANSCRPAVTTLIGLYVPPRPTIAWEWDFAAPDLFMHEAGGHFTDLAGRRFRYNKPGEKNDGGLIMAKNGATIAGFSTPSKRGIS
ncbi:MAG: inositol monophosphatase family protein [Thermomicrobiales bacterium]